LETSEALVASLESQIEDANLIEGEPQPNSYPQTQSFTAVAEPKGKKTKVSR